MDWLHLTPTGPASPIFFCPCLAWTGKIEGWTTAHFSYLLAPVCTAGVPVNSVLQGGHIPPSTSPSMVDIWWIVCASVHHALPEVRYIIYGALCLCFRVLQVNIFPATVHLTVPQCTSLCHSAPHCATAQFSVPQCTSPCSPQPSRPGVVWVYLGGRPHSPPCHPS